MKIALGTAQFGLDYGVSNVAGRVPADEVASILDCACSAGVDVLDSAWAYGDAERVLGELRAAERFRIVTKTAPLAEDGVPGVAAKVRESIERLGATPLYGLLVHHPADLLGDDGPELAEMLQKLKASGAVERIGVSGYGAQELFAALEMLGDADLVQVPINVFDQRLVSSGALAKLKARGIEVHARSAYLQGLLLMDPSEIPDYFDPIRDRIAAWRVFCAERSLTPLAALGFVTGIDEVEHVVVGVESAQQLAGVLAAAEPFQSADFAELAIDDPELVDPSRWSVRR
ncbi:MAG: aldo/keto reductase [Coriobacteriia bacterium]